MERTNEITLIFDSLPVNEALARITAASFCTQLNPTLEEVADLKTAVSEAVTNSIIHGYEGEVHKIEMKLLLTGQEIYVEITDHGKGIEDVEKAMEPMYTTKADKDRSGIRQRQKEGIAIAKAQGKYKGRAKKEINKELFENTKIRWQNGEITKVQFADIMGISRSTLYSS